MIQNGHIGQVSGPFLANTDLLEDNQPIGAFTPETERPVIVKLGVQAAEGTIVCINGANIKIGKTGIYELDDVINIKELYFPNGADESTLIDFVYKGDLYR